VHLLLIHQAFEDEHGAGGTRHIELARALATAGHRTTVVTSDVSYLTGTRRGEVKGSAEGADTVSIIYVRAFPILHRGFAYRVLSFLGFMVSAFWTSLRIHEVTVVMGTSPPLFQAVSAWAVARLRGVPFVLEIRDLWPAFAVEMGALRSKCLIFAAVLLERFLYRRAAHIIINSPGYLRHITKAGVSEDRIVLVSNGVDTQMFMGNDGAANVRTEFGLGDAFVVTYAGALGPANDIDTLLRAAERLRGDSSILMLLVGDGKERRRLEDETKRRGLTNVRFVGPKPKRMMPGILAASDVCIAILRGIPMFRLTYPNKVFDYMAAGKPTILAIDGVIRQVLEAAKGGLAVPPGDDLAIAEAVIRLRGNTDERAAMGKSAQDYVVRHFDRRRQAHEFLSVLERAQLATR